jgi:hypothetical protein
MPVVTAAVSNWIQGDRSRRVTVIDLVNSSNSTAVLPCAKTLKFTPLEYTVAPSGKLLPGETTVFIRRDLGSLFFVHGRRSVVVVNP